MLTFLVKSAQVPCTPSTLAWPPSIPWALTSKATRVTSEAKAESWSTMELTVPFDRGDKVFWVRSFQATAVVTIAIEQT